MHIDFIYWKCLFGEQNESLILKIHQMHSEKKIFAAFCFSIYAVLKPAHLEYVDTCFWSSICDTEKLLPGEDTALGTFKCSGVQADCFPVNSNLKETSHTRFC